MRKLLTGVVLFSLGLSFATARMTAQRNTSPPVRVGANLDGVVSGVNGPEAGVWVIAETGDLPAPFSKVVVTDDLGRYVIPDLPKANYRVWVHHGASHGGLGSTANLVKPSRRKSKE